MSEYEMKAFDQKPQKVSQWHSKQVLSIFSSIGIKIS